MDEVDLKLQAYAMMQKNFRPDSFIMNTGRWTSTEDPFSMSFNFRTNNRYESDIYETLRQSGRFSPDECEGYAREPRYLVEDFVKARNQPAPNAELIEKLKAKLLEQDVALAQLTEPAQTFGTVVSVDEELNAVIVQTERGLTQLVQPKDLKLQTKDIVTLSGQTGQILAKCELSSWWNRGEVVTIIQADFDYAQVKRDAGAPFMVLHTYAPGLLPAGARVILDIFNKFIVAVLPESAPIAEPQFHSVRWDEIGGNVQAKAELREAITLIKGGNELTQAYGLSLPRGILFYGPPGCGKTMLGRAAATELSCAEGSFIYVKGPEILSKYVGEAESTIRQLFSQAKDHSARTGQRPLIFIDEAESILRRRGSGLSSDVEKTIVPTFLTEMDGLDETSAMIILATNRPDVLDPAIIRDGRIDKRICVERPDFDAGQEILRINLMKGPLGEELSDLTVLATELIYVGTPELHSHLSGAFLAGFIEHARRHAYRRDLVACNSTPSGISSESLHLAFSDLQKEYLHGQ